MPRPSDICSCLWGLSDVICCFKTINIFRISTWVSSRVYYERVITFCRAFVESCQGFELNTKAEIPHIGACTFCKFHTYILSSCWSDVCVLCATTAFKCNTLSSSLSNCSCLGMSFFKTGREPGKHRPIHITHLPSHKCEKQPHCSPTLHIIVTSQFLSDTSVIKRAHNQFQANTKVGIKEQRPISLLLPKTIKRIQ